MYREKKTNKNAYTKCCELFQSGLNRLKHLITLLRYDSTPNLINLLRHSEFREGSLTLIIAGFDKIFISLMKYLVLKIKNMFFFQSSKRFSLIFCFFFGSMNDSDLFGIIFWGTTWWTCWYCWSAWNKTNDNLKIRCLEYIPIASLFVMQH